MFNELRRPVPSKAALRILYQLAYVTSGTAMGIATLCVEERRRKTRLVQKIADNAKRIRQSPKYRPLSAAAAVATTEDTVTWDLATSGGFQPAPRDEYSPSEVDRGYRRVVKQHRKAQRRRLDAGAEEQADQRRERRAVKGKTGDCVMHGAVKSQTENKPRHESFRVYKRLPQKRVLDYIGTLEVAFPARPTRWDKDPESLQPDDIAHFFEVQPWTYSGQEERRVADRLLDFALKAGTFDAIRSLYEWMLARGALKASQIHALCEACHDLPDEGHRERFLGLYRSLFKTPEFRELSALQRARFCLKVAVASTYWDNSSRPTPHGFYQVARRLAIRSALLGVRDSDLFQEVQVLCREQIVARNPERASRYLQMISEDLWGPERALESKQWEDLRDEVTSSLLQEGELFAALSHVLRQLRRTDQDHAQYLEQISVACAKHRSYKCLAIVLRSAFGRTRLSIEKILPLLSNEAKTALAGAYIKHGEGYLSESLFQKVLSALPEDVRGRLFETQTSEVLHTTWSATRNFEATFERYDATRALGRRSGVVELSHAATLTMIDICNDADRPQQALALLKNLNEAQSQACQILVRAGVSLAQKRSWTRLSSLLELLVESGSFVQDGHSTGCFNRIIQLYSRGHSAADTWKFLTYLIQDLGFVPTKITNRIVLCSFVEQRCLSLIKRWTRYLGTLGEHYQLDGKTAANLMSVFYLDQRPPHELVMWYSRKMIHALPRSDSSVFERVMTEAIAHDLRKSRKVTRRKADMNLFQLRNAGESVPSPAGLRGLLSATTTGTTKSQPVGQSGDIPGSIDSCVSADEPIEVAIQDYERSRIARTSGSSLTEFEEGFPREVFSDIDRKTSDRTDLSQQTHPETPDDLLSRRESERRKEVESEMIVEISRRDYAKVLDIYFASLSASMLPVSVRALEIAIDASVRWRGDRSEADEMLTKARLAGLDVSAAQRPLIKHQISSLRLGSQGDVARLRESVIEWYNTHAEKGTPQSHLLGVSAAKALINARYPEHAVNLLSVLQEMSSAHHEPTSIKVMATYLRCYAALANLDGIKWTIHTVLHNNLSIDDYFLKWLRVWRNHFSASSVIGHTFLSQRTTELGNFLQHALEHCRRRRLRQRLYTKTFGRNLAKIVQRVIRRSEQPVVPVAARKMLEADLFTVPQEGQHDVLDEEDPSDPRTAEFRALRARIARSIGPTRHSVPHRHCEKSITRGHIWAKQYRSFLRKDIALPSGRLVAFRYTDASRPAAKYSRQYNVHRNARRLGKAKQVINMDIEAMQRSPPGKASARECFDFMNKAAANSYLPFGDDRVEDRAQLQGKAGSQERVVDMSKGS